MIDTRLSQIGIIGTVPTATSQPIIDWKTGLAPSTRDLGKRVTVEISC